MKNIKSYIGSCVWKYVSNDLRYPVWNSLSSFLEDSLEGSFDNSVIDSAWDSVENIIKKSYE